jgi:acyl-CoA synthetase (AMP-forming)/AMP-acid ligase II
VAASDFTLADVLAGNARRHGARPAFIEDGRTTTHAQLWARSGRLAAGLRAAGVAAGDRIALLSPNRTEFIELVAAAARLGAVVSAINWRLSAAEVALVVDNDAPRLLVVEHGLWALLDTLLERDTPQPELVCLGPAREGFRSFDALYAPTALPPAQTSADAPLLLIHTAWSDGRPKAAMLSHRNLLAAALQLQAVWQLDAPDVHLCCLPLFHITALSLVLATLLAGGCSVLQPKFDPVQAVDAAAAHKVTLFGEFAPMLASLLAQPDAAMKLASVRHVCGLDAPDTIRAFEAACPGATFWSGYGQSEACGMVSIAPFSEAQGSVGSAMPLVALEVVDDEIVVRGPTVFLGYWNRPEETAWALRSGMLHTGDTGRIDAQGRLWYTGRLAAKELIKTGGENVYPAEVEAVLREHPAIADVAVIGVKDAKWGEAVRAICVATGTEPAPQELIDFVGGRIAHFKRPRSVVFTTALPKKADGSTDRDQIKALFSGL